MHEDRLSPLPLIHTHYDMPVDLDAAVNIFSQTPPKKTGAGQYIENVDTSKTLPDYLDFYLRKSVKNISTLTTQITLLRWASIQPTYVVMLAHRSQPT